MHNTISTPKGTDRTAGPPALYCPPAASRSKVGPPAGRSRQQLRAARRRLAIPDGCLFEWNMRARVLTAWFHTSARKTTPGPMPVMHRYSPANPQTQGLPCARRRPSTARLLTRSSKTGTRMCGAALKRMSRTSRSAHATLLQARVPGRDTARKGAGHAARRCGHDTLAALQTASTSVASWVRTLTLATRKRARSDMQRARHASSRLDRHVPRHGRRSPLIRTRHVPPDSRPPKPGLGHRGGEGACGRTGRATKTPAAAAPPELDSDSASTGGGRLGAARPTQVAGEDHEKMRRREANQPQVFNCFSCPYLFMVRRAPRKSPQPPPSKPKPHLCATRRSPNEAVRA